MTERLDPYQLFAAGEFRCLLDFLRAERYSVVDCLVQNRQRQKRTLSFRYDVHWRDVHVAHGFLRVHRERSLPGTFFLHHGYSALERSKAGDFSLLADAIRTAQDAGAPVQLGFHDSPVDRYLLWQYAGGDETRFVEWLSSSSAEELFSDLAASERKRQEFHAAVLQTFVVAVREARAALGPFLLSAGHGGKISQVLRPRVAELGDAGQVLSECFAENWLTPERLAAAEVVGDLERFKREVPEVTAITEGGGRIEKMCGDLKRYMAVGRPMVTLIHPATWGKSGKRDAEWSQRLELPALRVVVATNAAALEKDVVGGALRDPYDLAVFTEPGAEDAAVASDELARERAALLDLLADPGHGRRAMAPTLGTSLSRYGALVTAMLRATLGASDEQTVGGRRASALARFVEQEACRIDKGGATPSEWAYFLFSSPPRALVLARALGHFLGDAERGEIARFVDHGTGIGFMPLVIHDVLPLGQVAGTEVKPQFVNVGRALWNAVGLGHKMSFAQVSVTEYEYGEASDVVCFGHVLYRIPPELRRQTLRAATDSLRPGGMVVINELMNRPDLDGRYAYNCLTSTELISYLDPDLEVSSVDVTGTKVDVVPAVERPDSFFARSNNLVVARRKRPDSQPNGASF